MGDMSARDLIAMCNKISNDFDKDSVVILEYTSVLDMWISTLKHLGAAIAIAFKDTKDKAKNMRNNRELFTKQLKMLEENSPDANFIQPFCVFETKLNVAHLNGDYKNKKPLKKFKKAEIQPWMPGYTSTSRHLWRNSWLFQFLALILHRIATERTVKLSKLAKEVYKVVLKPNHPYWLQKVANAAMLAVNNRAKFIKSYMDEQSRVQKKQFTEEMAY